MLRAWKSLCCLCWDTSQLMMLAECTRVPFLITPICTHMGTVYTCMVLAVNHVLESNAWPTVFLKCSPSRRES
ncbi:hypothetical protein C8R45DRAFT_990145, partial [Mycena sanguinolenta]